MAITEKDLQKVRVVLSGEVSLQQVAREYSLRDSVLVCAAIFTAAGTVMFTWRGEYRRVLKELVLKPGFANTSLPKKSEDWPAWTDKGMGLVDAAKRIGLHDAIDGGGNKVKTHLLPEMSALLDEDDSYKERALAWYLRARQVVQERHEADLRRKAQERKFHAALRRRLPYSIMAHEYGVDHLRELYDVLGELFTEYFPEG